MSSKVAGVLSSTKAKRASDRSRGVLDKGTMNNSLKGAFLSGLIFPGLGQVLLKHYKRGAVIMFTVLASLSVVIAKAAQHGLSILEKIESEGGAISMSSLSNMATTESSASGSLTIKFIMIFVILCWIFSVFDAYRIGKKKDIEESLIDQVSNGNGH